MFAALKLDQIELGDAIDQVGDGLAEICPDVFAADPGILDHVVQQGRSQGLHVHVPAGQGLSYGQRMADIGFAALAQLALVSVGAEGQRLGQYLGLVLLQVRGDDGGIVRGRLIG